MAFENSMAFQTPQLESPLNNLAKIMAIQHSQSANALQQYQLKQAERGDAESNAMRVKWQELSTQPGGFDVNNPAHVAALVGTSPTGATALVKGLTDVNKERALTDQYRTTAIKTKQEISNQAMRDMAANPSDENVKATVARMVEQGVFTKEQAAESLQSLIGKSPFERILHWGNLGMSGKDMSEMMASKPEKHDDGKKVWYTEGNASRPDYGKTLTAAPAFNKVADPNAVLSAETQVKTTGMTNKVAREGHTNTATIAGKRLAAEIDPKTQEAIAGAKARGTETAKADVELQTTRKAETAGAKQVLKMLNFDAASGSDDITKLIPQSTSGMIRRGLSAAKGEVTGVGTPGAEAIGKLKVLANKLALDIAGGKLGAGISNTDRDFIAQSLGDVANPNLNANVRAAAWTAARKRLEQLTNQTPAAPAAPALPAGFKPD